MILPSLVFVFCLPHTFENVTSFCLFIDFFKLAGSLWHSLMNVFLFVSPLVTILRDNVTVDSIATFLVPTSKLKGFSASLIITITLLRLSYNFFNTAVFQIWWHVFLFCQSKCIQYLTDKRHFDKMKVHPCLFSSSWDSYWLCPVLWFASSSLIVCSSVRSIGSLEKNVFIILM